MYYDQIRLIVCSIELAFNVVPDLVSSSILEVVCLEPQCVNGVEVGRFDLVVEDNVRSKVVTGSFGKITRAEDRGWQGMNEPHGKRDLARLDCSDIIVIPTELTFATVYCLGTNSTIQINFLQFFINKPCR